MQAGVDGGMTGDGKSLHGLQQHFLDPDSGDDNNSGEDKSDGDGDGDDGRDFNARGLKRKRPISVSCELCKQRKVKCDRGQPSCGWCSRNGAVCEYKERKKPGLRAGYGRELEARLDKLEAILRRHSELLQMPFDANGQPLLPRTDSHSLPGVLRPPGSVRGSNGSPSEDRGTPHDHASATALFTRVEPVQTPQAEAALFLQRPSRGSFSTVQAAAGVIGAMSPSRHSQPSPLSTPAAREFYGTAAAAVQQPNTGTTGSSPMPGVSGGVGGGAGSSSSSRAYPGSDQDLPPYDLSYALVDLYFKHINTWCPLLQRNPTIEALFGPAMTDETNKILLHAIVATTLRFSTDARLTDEKRQRYHDISKQRVILYGMENSSVKALQAMVILALDLCGSSNGPPGWNIMALITRAVVQLGLAVEANSFSVSPSYMSIYTLRARILPEPRDFIEEESRRRLFWVIYMLDRYATIATAFEFALDDHEIDRALPCRDDLWAKNQRVETRLFRPGYESSGEGENNETDGNPSRPESRPENLGAFSYYIEILGILTLIHNFLKQPVDISSLSDVEQWQMRYRELDQMLADWKLSLPGEFGNMSRLFQTHGTKTLTCAWVMLHVTYHTAIIRLHSSAAYPTTRSPIFTPSYSASQRCHSAVENIATLAEFVVGTGSGNSGNPSGSGNSGNNGNNLLPKLGPPFAFSLWVAARLLLVHGSTVEHKLSARVAFFVDVLRAMGRYWPVADRYCALLQRVLDEHRDSQRQGDGVTPSSVRILADMRRTAFDLDLLISRQPRHGGGGVPGGPGGQGIPGGTGAVGTPVASMYDVGLGPLQTTGPGVSRLPSITPARTPQPHDLEYLDVFDFFNVPRLPFNMPTEVNGTGNGTGGNNGNSADPADTGEGRPSTSVTNEFNITDFMIDANQDWLFKQETSNKFL